MKKEKIMLSAIAILALAGGAFAFKVKTFIDNTLLRPTGTTTINGITYPLCPFEPNVAIRTVSLLGTFYTTLSTIGTVSNICAGPTFTRGTIVEE